MIKRALIVDDSQIAIIKLEYILKNIGYETVSASTGLEGVEAVKQDAQISLIIADINMPGMSGLEMCEKIRGIPEHKTTDIIMCTTDSNPKLKERAKLLGVKCWIVKPVGEAQFRKVIEALNKKAG